MEFKFSDPATDFSDGLLVLQSYHKDFLARGVSLLALVGQIKLQAMNEELANQCVAMYCHYSHANLLHHQDEEQALFPLLVGHSALFDGMIERLMMDHEEIETAWALLAGLLRQPEQITDNEQFLQFARDFEKLQREHLIREDEDFLPKVKAHLKAEKMMQAGKKMAQLRHLPT